MLKNRDGKCLRVFLSRYIGSDTHKMVDGFTKKTSKIDHRDKITVVINGKSPRAYYKYATAATASIALDITFAGAARSLQKFSGFLVKDMPLQFHLKKVSF